MKEKKKNGEVKEVKEKKKAELKDDKDSKAARKGSKAIKDPIASVNFDLEAEV